MLSFLSAVRFLNLPAGNLALPSRDRLAKLRSIRIIPGKPLSPLCDRGPRFRIRAPVKTRVQC